MSKYYLLQFSKQAVEGEEKWRGTSISEGPKKEGKILTSFPYTFMK